MAELAFRDGIWEQIRLRETRFDEHAYLFVLAALEFQQGRMTERRHIDGRELASAVRDLALEKFGVMARLVLEHWGVRATADVGDIVFTMVDLGLLMSQPTDSRLDFVDVYEFDQAFEVGLKLCEVRFFARLHPRDVSRAGFLRELVHKLLGKFARALEVVSRDAC